MRQVLMLGVALAFLLSGCANTESLETISSQANSQQESTPVDPQEIETETLAENLATPWSIEKAADTFYLSEREGTIIKITNDENQRQTVNFSEPVSSVAEGGFLGFVLSPDFTDLQEAYGYYTYEREGTTWNRIVQLQLSDNQWLESNILLDEIPGGINHHGGRLKIGADNKLYATTGDASEPDIAQDLDSLAGKILRLNLDGTIPNDNPFPESYVYSYGHRNAQGLAWNENDLLYASEHGASGNDEINLIEPGSNYGWPVIEGTATNSGMKSPLFTSGSDETWAPSGMAYHNQALYTAALRGTAVLRFDLETEEITEIISDFGRIRDVYIEGDQLYFITNNRDGRGNPTASDDQLVRIALSDIVN